MFTYTRSGRRARSRSSASQPDSGKFERNSPASSPGAVISVGRELAALGRDEVDRDRALPLVEPGPVEADAVVGDRPALVVEAAADGVEADDVGAELREREPAERRGDERRPLDHAQSREQCHAAKRYRRANSPGQIPGVPVVARLTTAGRSPDHCRSQANRSGSERRRRSTFACHMFGRKNFWYMLRPPSTSSSRISVPPIALHSRW